MMAIRVCLFVLASLPAIAAAERGHIGAAYGAASAELATAGAIAIHAYTASSPGEGVGLAVNFLPVVVGVGTGVLAEMNALDARPALGVHGAVIGGLPLMALGAAIR